MVIFGRRQPDALIPQVEANLLREYLEEKRAASAAASKNRMTLGATLTALGILLLGFPTMIWSNLSAKAAAQREMEGLDQNGFRHERDLKETEALRAQAVLFSSARHDSVNSLNHLVNTLNAKPEGVVVRKLILRRAEKGRLEVSGQAEAATLADANGFVRRIEDQAKGSEAILSTARQSTVMGTRGVVFDFVSSLSAGGAP